VPQKEKNHLVTICHSITNEKLSTPKFQKPNENKLHTIRYLIALVDRFLQRLARVAHIQKPANAKNKTDTHSNFANVPKI
jgi:hypothetical protein